MVQGDRKQGRESIEPRRSVYMLSSRILAFITLLISLQGHAGVDPQRFTGPNGRTAYAMKCSGLGRDWDDCYKAAGELCPAGYNIIDQASGVVGVPTTSGLFVAPKQTLAIECR